MNMTKSAFSKAARCLMVGVTVLFTGCADLTVTKVTDTNKDTVEGIHYYLPKPFLQVTPQADGTVTADVIYLPDKSHEYVIASSSVLSSYTCQISRDEKGLLLAVEYKASTSTIGQQLAASAGATAAQAYTIDSAQLSAVQSQVNTAQASLDTANGTYQSAVAALQSDLSNGATNSVLIIDSNAVAQAQVKVPIAEAALKRAQTSAQAVSSSISPSSPATTTGPTIGTIFGQPAWNTPVVYNLPSKFGPVLFAIDDKMDGSTETVSLDPVTNNMAGTGVGSVDELEAGVSTNAQRTFETSGSPAPTIGPANQTFKLGDTNSVSFVFSQPILKLGTVTVIPDPPAPIDQQPPHTLDPNNLVLYLNISKLKLGSFNIQVPFYYLQQATTNTAFVNRSVNFSIQP